LKLLLHKIVSEALPDERKSATVGTQTFMTMTNSGDEGVKFADLSGLAVEPGENPFAAFIKACNNDSVSISLFISHTAPV
jgi:hypothetical protein